MDVREEPRPEARPGRQHASAQVERDAVDEVAQEQLKADVAVRRQRQRNEEVLAELAVRDPRLRGIPLVEGKAVDQDGAAAVELDVVRACVPEPHAGRQGSPLQLEGEQRGLPELAE
jgi:hypothetical protein